MGMYAASYQDCEFCGEEFESVRSDARFCQPRCRTAHHRREKRREQAAEGIARQWAGHITASYYDELVTELPGIAPAIQDIFIEHSAEAAEAAVRLVHKSVRLLVNAHEAQQHRLKQRIEFLESEQEVLDVIEKAINSRVRLGVGSRW